MAVRRNRDFPSCAMTVAMLLLGSVSIAKALAASDTPVNTVPDGFTFAAGGDMIGPYHAFPDSTDEEFLRVVSLIKSADLAFANQEGSIFDLETFQGYPAAENGGGYPQQRYAAAIAIKGIGIALVSKANNHATDWGAEGLVATLHSLAAAGIAQAGSGLSLAEARAPAYASTTQGLAALVSAASTFPPMSVAGPAVDKRGVLSRPRPGISALHVREIHRVLAARLAMLRKTMGGVPDGAQEIRIGDELFRAAREPGRSWEMDASDEDAILASIREARSKARFVIFSIHAHETAGDSDVPGPADYEPMVLHKANEAPSPDDPQPASFEVTLFHAAIDAGADVVVRTGPHVINGIEIYKGKPIFYSLGSLFFDFGGRRSYTTPAGEKLTFPEEWFETILPVSTYQQGSVSEIRLYPLMIDSGTPATSGIPHLADAADARRILERLKAQSAQFGTEMRILNNVGVIGNASPK
jgi:poly-gamma-glutamate capsule biosynthesis protein CapA/YwtB (metallophosphatase superfamily)